MRWSPGFSLKRSRHTTFAVLSVFRHDPLSYLFLKLSDHLGRYMFLVEAQVDLTELGKLPEVGQAGWRNRPFLFSRRS